MIAFLDEYRDLSTCLENIESAPFGRSFDAAVFSRDKASS